MLEKLQKLVGESDDIDAECILDDRGINYTIVDAGDWIDDGKYQYRNFDVKISDKFYSFSESRSGSYYTDWYYSIQDVCEYTPDTRHHVTYTFPNQKVAQQFVSFVECSGEDLMNELDVMEGDFRAVYDLDRGSLEFK